MYNFTKMWLIPEQCIVWREEGAVKLPHIVADCTADLFHVAHGIWLRGAEGMELDRL